MQFNHFIIKDDEPVLYHTGSSSMFPMVREAVRQLIAPEKIRWIGFSHYEADECGSINEWLALAPFAQVVGTVTAIRVNLSGNIIREARALSVDEVLQTGKYRFRMIPTPHLPHGWDAGMFFEETHRTLFCSDLFHQTGDVEPVTHASVLGRARQVLLNLQGTPLTDYMPYTTKTEQVLQQLAAQQPKALATQHGSTFVGDGVKELLELASVIKEIYADD